MAIANSGMTLYADHDTQETWVGTDDLDDYGTSMQGANSESWIVAKNGTETGTMTKSANMGTSKYFIGWMKSDLTNYYTSIKQEIQSTTNNFESFTIADTADRDVTGEFHPYVLQFGQGTSTGTLDKTALATFRSIVDNSTSGNIRSVTNNWLDTMHYGDGRVLGGTTVSDALFLESHVADTTTSDEYDGCSEIFPSGLAYYTDITIDTTTGNSYGETVTFYGSRNTDSVFTIDVTGTAVFQNAIIGNNCKVNIDTSTATAFGSDGSSVKYGGTITYASGQTIENTVYSVCDTITPDQATFQNNSIADTISTTGSLYLGDATAIANTSGITFSGYTGYNAIYIPATVTGTITLNNFTGDGSGVDIYWGGSTGTLTVNKSNGTNFSTWDSAGTGTSGNGDVLIVASVSIAINVKNQAGANIDGAYVYIDEDLEAVGQIINTTTDINGDVSTSYSGVATLATVRVRKYGFKPYVGIISLDTDSNTNVILITDPQQT